MRFWLVTLLQLLLLVLIGALAGWWWGTVPALVLIVVFLFIKQAYQTWQVRRFRHWLQTMDTSHLPEEAGIWGDIFVDLARAQKQHIHNREQLSAALERFREATSALPDGVLMLDADDRIEWFNALARTQFGLDPDRDVGTLVTNLLRQPEFAAYMDSSKRELNDGREPLLLRVGQGKVRDLSLLLVPFAGGQLVYSRDVTQLQRVETMRRDFIANVSHELRTPLTVILGFLDPLAHDKDLPDESRAHFWKMIQDQAERMRRLVEDLLTLSRLEAQSELQQEDVVAVPVLLATLIEEGQTLSCGRHRFESEIAAGNLTGSVSELRSAFGNLISNAVRYTPEGGCIKVRWVLEGEGVLFEVSDTGPGIAAEHIPRLTERFYRVDKGRSTQTGGTGLGLSIVKYVLLHHQARLEIQSELGQGSRFRAWFPRARWVV